MSSGLAGDEEPYAEVGRGASVLMRSATVVFTIAVSVTVLGAASTGIASNSLLSTSGAHKVPDPPRAASVVVGSGDATVSFVPPDRNGGPEITGYRATCESTDGGPTRASAFVPASPIKVTGISNAKIYACSVVARNSVGVSAPSSATGAMLVGASGPVAAHPGAEYVISPGANVASALARLRPGDILLLHGGVYVGDVKVALKPGNAKAPVLVAAYPGERPVIKGVFWITSPSYYTFFGVNVTWNAATDTASEHMVKVTNGVGWTLENAELWGAHSFADLLVAGTVAGQPSKWKVAANCIHDTYRTHATNQDQLIYVNTGLRAGSGEIDHNLLFNATNGMGVKVGGGNSAQGSAHVTIDHNTIVNTSQSVLVAWASYDDLISRNIMATVAPNNGNIRGYELTGRNNVAKQNIGYNAKSLINNYNGGRGIANAGGNLFPVNPDFHGGASCSGFKPGNPLTRGYGR